jgi:hypothetical protein
VEATSAVLKFLREAGLLGVLILILFGGWKRWWVFGWQHDRVIERYERELVIRQQERDEWKRMAMAQAAVLPSPYEGPERRSGNRSYKGPERRRKVTRDQAQDSGVQDPPHG